MSTQQPDAEVLRQQFEEGLSALEQYLETPLVPGELEEWLQMVRNSFAQFTPILQEQIQQVHQANYDEIAEEDPELLRQVTTMQEEDEAIAAKRAEIDEWLKSLETRFQGGASETDLKEDLNQFVTKSLMFVIRVRKQEVTVRTWLMEAFLRDRGPVD